MVDCRKCQRFSACYFDNDDCIGFVPKTMTHADRIRNMTDEELAEFLGRTKAYCCIDSDPTSEFVEWFRKWLKEDVKE